MGDIYGKYETAGGYLFALGSSIKRRREANKLSLEAVSKATEVTKGEILSIETGNINAKTAAVLKVANAVGIELCADTQELGRRIAALRIYRGMKQSDVERASDITRATLVRIEHGGNTRIGSILSVCEVFEVAPMRILKQNL